VLVLAAPRKTLAGLQTLARVLTAGVDQARTNGVTDPFVQEIWREKNALEDRSFSGHGAAPGIQAQVPLGLR
jgi:hypothetical protein